MNAKVSTLNHYREVLAEARKPTPEPLVLIEELENIPYKARKAKYKCGCGEVFVTQMQHVKSGATRSCGCFHRQGLADRVTTHGLTDAPIYSIWTNMRRRCADPKNKAYYRYGGRGITVCDRWQTFENFLADMGQPPLGLTLDRIDNDGNYEPANCRWATRQQQTDNRSVRTHCAQGHELSGANVISYPSGNRACRTCKDSYREKHKQEENHAARVRYAHRDHARDVDKARVVIHDLRMELHTVIADLQSLASQIHKEVNEHQALINRAKATLLRTLPGGELDELDAMTPKQRGDQLADAIKNICWAGAGMPGKAP